MTLRCLAIVSMRAAGALALLASSLAAAPQMVWADRNTDPGVHPGVVRAHAAAYDSARQRTVLFGGWPESGGLPSSQATWEWDGAVWTPHGSARWPSGIVDLALVYDAARGEVVAFGGRDASLTEVDETWVWDGSAWTQRSPATRPPARSAPRLCYDAARQRVVLFGGVAAGGTNQLGDTWEWDGATWLARTPAASPTARAGHAMAYDRARGRVVLFGGGRSPFALLADTWEWDGSTWLQRQPATEPPARSAHAMAYDSTRQRTVSMGGFGGLSYLADTWEWDGNDWQERKSSTTPPGHAEHVLVFDAARGRATMVGYLVLRYQRPATWEWDGNDWRLAVPRSPTARRQVAMAYDESRARTVLFSGNLSSSGDVMIADTWEWDGSAWQVRTSTDAPAARKQHGMVYDQRRGIVLVFGGSQGAGSSMAHDFWGWDGSQWLRQPAPTTPSVGNASAIAYDSARDRVVLFGGAGPNGATAETWEYDAVDWRRRQPVNAPPGRYQHAMAHDPVRARTVLFGGTDGSQILADTWEWDGSDWQQRFPPTVPAPRAAHSMTWDADRERVVMFGWSSAGGESGPWEWNGHDWRRQSTAAPPPARTGHAAAWDRARGRLVVFGGTSGPVRADTWESWPTVRGSATARGAGCPGSAGVPAIEAVGAPVVGSPDFAVRLSSLRRQTFVIVAFSIAKASVPLPGGCTLLVMPPWIEVRTASDLMGTARAAVPIPASTALSGARVFGQGFALDPQGAYFGLAAFTAGLDLRIGD